MTRPLAVILGLVVLRGAVCAQISSTASPVHHGALDIARAAGRFDPETGIASLRVRHWRLRLSADSNAIFPDREPALVALGENNFFLPAGALVAARRGRVFRYRAPPGGGPRAVRSLRLARAADGSYRVTLSLVGLDLSRLRFQDPLCLPLAIIIGDDDGFSGASLTRPSEGSHRLLLPRACEPSNAWPWL